MDNLTNVFAAPDETQDEHDLVEDKSIKSVSVNFNEQGHSGTEVFSGFFTEEYLQKLQDQCGPD